ncbi:acyl-coenzyme A synthetase/AMP-(fatty) acid ligase [Cupriavidus gilardii J11]|uniref:Acyl-coenzyme A synthetase/AMP-(Fatty) acid ligase n=1 Tax=Cupriavidus gilardii J11 TaxID=936133 RepID=A0A562BL47_9BURK|nr:AMP-binding protein [Cupriavidus gilardii]TWG85968.1 acyl-coenzyme A synthetase/AMP-(fatty) acid ligase [Cupriavidus gilardii J11]
METTLPLLAHTRADAIVAYRQHGPVAAARFLADVRRLAAALPPGRHVLNVCRDRYLFAVGLCAVLLARKISVLPAAQTAEAVRELAAFAPDVFCLHDAPHCDIALPKVHVVAPPPEPMAGHARARRLVMPRIPARRTLAYLFTSGSTGAPTPHRKTWGEMVANARSAAARLQIDPARGGTLVGTVPAQHMYGLECTIMLALQGGIALSDAHPFYPADVASVLQAMPSPRLLVASPVHLRAILASTASLPPLDKVLSATAPLAARVAREMEERSGAALVEIYGSTETGHIATRRTAHEAAWRLLPGLRLDHAPGSSADAQADAQADIVDWRVRGGHLRRPVPLNDAIEPLDAGRLLLHGRKSDLVKIAGKRTSLAYLNQQLLAIDGVVDGVFHLRKDGENGGLAKVERLTAVVVAPALSAADIVQALRGRIDAAFLPRRLLFVEALPRNAAGKLPLDALEALLLRQSGTPATAVSSEP